MKTNYTAIEKLTTYSLEDMLTVATMFKRVNPDGHIILHLHDSNNDLVDDMTSLFMFGNDWHGYRFTGFQQTQDGLEIYAVEPAEAIEEELADEASPSEEASDAITATYEMYFDNAGHYHIAIMTGNVCTCLWTSGQYDKAGAIDALEAIKSGADPVADGWYPLSETPQEDRDNLASCSTSGGAELVEFGDIA